MITMNDVEALSNDLADRLVDEFNLVVGNGAQSVDGNLAIAITVFDMPGEAPVDPLLIETLPKSMTAGNGDIVPVVYSRDALPVFS